MILGFWELPEEDQPPQEIWLDDAAINEHFEWIKERRESKTAHDKRDAYEAVPQPPMDQNELTRGWR